MRASSSNSGHAVLEEGTIRAVVAQAHRAHKPVFVHPSTGDDVVAALHAGVDVIAHTTPRSGAWNEEILGKHAMRHDRRSLQDQTVATAVGQLRDWRAAGGIVLFGTDIGAVDPDPSDEYALMQRAGMSSPQILASMTLVPADFFDGPLADDSAALARVRLTIRSGKIIYRTGVRYLPWEGRGP